MISTMEQESLLVAVSAKLRRRMTVFVIGGTAMILSGSKEATKDIDLVFTGNRDKGEFAEAAKSLGYEHFDPHLIYGTKDNQPMVLKRTDERFDLFGRKVISFTFSDSMEVRAAATHEFGKNLVVRVADPHDVILMKSATERLKDIDDIRSIIQNSRMDWDVIVGESRKQIGLGNARPVFDLLGNFLTLKELGVAIPESVFKKIWDELFPGHSGKGRKSGKPGKESKPNSRAQ
jgi:hypothetical protein